jgi:hypothetical protein
MKISKTAILPVVTVLSLAYAAITGHEISKDLLDKTADIAAVVISAGISIWGVIKNHKKGDVQ